MKRRLVALPAFTFALTMSCLPAVCSPCRADVSFLAQVRRVAARALWWESETLSPNFGAFHERVDAGGNPEIDRGSRGSASQDSTLAPSRIEVTGSSLGSGGWQSASGSGASEFDVTFAVDAATPFSLFGFWRSDSGPNLSDIAVELSGPGGIIFADGSLAPVHDDRQPVGDFTVDGTLAPGAYRLRAFSRGGAAGFQACSGEFGVTLLMPPPDAACAGGWSWGAPAWEPDAPVLCVAEWDADGAGGESPRLLAGGEFTSLGGSPVGHIAAWSRDRQVWEPLGTGLDGIVRCVLPLREGGVVAGGDFTGAGGVPASRLARWTGSAWMPMGEGSIGRVDALVQLPDGSVIASGEFPTASPGLTARVARWDGSRWTPMGAGEINGRVMGLAMARDGRIVAGGEFFFLDDQGNAVIGVAAWNGVHWDPIGDAGSTVTFSLAVSPDGDIVSGDLNGAVRRWNGTSWSTIPRPSGVPYSLFYAVAVSPGGDIVAGGDFDMTQPCCDHPWRYPVIRWDGSRWTTLATGLNAVVRALHVDSSGTLVAGGDFTHSATERFDRLARWDGAAWTLLPTAPGVDDEVNAVLHDPSGADDSVIFGGAFSHAGDRPVAHIARRHDGRIEPLGAGIDGTVSALLRLPSGDLVAAGLFTRAGDVAARSVARWDGVRWHPLGAGLDGGVYDLALLPDGRLVAGGAFTNSGGTPLGRGLAAWDGSAWSSIDGGVNTGGSVTSLAVTPSGDLVVGGQFNTIGGTPIGWGIARLEGTTWHSLDGGVHDGGVHDVLALGDGSIIVGGDFHAAGSVVTSSIARWDGVAWSGIGGGVGIGSSRIVRAVTLTAGGELLVGGDFRSAGGIATPFLAMWDGGRWSTPDHALDGQVKALAALPDGSAAVGGGFSAAGSTVMNHLARFRPATTPTIQEQPQDTFACRGEMARLLATVADGAARWQVELPPRFSDRWTPLTDGPLPAETGSGTMIAGTGSDTLFFSQTDAAAALRYRVVVSNDCGTATSPPATLGFCPGDHNCDGGVDGADIASFFDAWERGSQGGDIDGDGAVDGHDVETFFVHWTGGC